MILAGSPQAKGRVERSFGTAQDQLVKEMRVEGIGTLEAANRFLRDYWVPFWNERFAVEPADPRDAHRPLPAGVDLEALFAETETRVVGRDFTIRFANRRWQIPEREAGGNRRWQIPEREAGGIVPNTPRPGHHRRPPRQARQAETGASAEVVVERRLDGDLRFRFGERYLDVEPARQDPATAAAPRAKPAKPRPAPPKPGPDHPWRKHFQASAQQAIARRSLRREREGISNGNQPPRTHEPPRRRGKNRTPGEDISIAP